MNLTGIWIDLRKAIVVQVKNSEARIMNVIESNMTVGNVKGGSRSSTPYGPQDAVSESKMLEKKKHVLTAFYEEIESKLPTSDHIHIVGPAGTKNELKDYLQQSHDLRDLPITSEVADSMTDNQVKALFRDFYKQQLSK